MMIYARLTNGHLDTMDWRPSQDNLITASWQPPLSLSYISRMPLLSQCVLLGAMSPRTVTICSEDGRKLHIHHACFCDGIVTSTPYSWKPLPNIYMNDKNVIGSSQHGFRKRKSCLTNLTAFYDETTSLTFDTVSHNILIDNQMKYRLDKWTVMWTENCLNNWAQRVLISNTKSNWRPVTSGIPQGLALGIILLNIFINNLDDGRGCTLSKSADDKVGGVVDNTKRDLDRLGKWDNRNFMKFNTAKQKILSLGWDSPRHQYLLGANWQESTTVLKVPGCICTYRLLHSCLEDELSTTLLASPSKAAPQQQTHLFPTQQVVLLLNTASPTAQTPVPAQAGCPALTGLCRNQQAVKYNETRAGSWHS
ncbi:hypothetical protein QYF61_001868 [Mycteria americana]|uniref:Reverse transcriptase domain-containing protein n=1 Tax=Mycteria americana TaxID=33587 RepID=A0AAN7NKC2_MYCAM|nr:hypothetical protein QYF61_001868 [Mycteria americana]